MDLPYDIKGGIVAHLPEDPALLCSISTVSKQFARCARSILFREVNVSDATRLRQLFELLSSEHRTLPNYIAAMVVDFRALDYQGAQGMTDGPEADDITNLLSRFDVSHTLSLNLPWALSRLMTDMMLWEPVVRYSSLRTLVLGGTYPRLDDAIEAVVLLSSLRSLVVNATWKSNNAPLGKNPPSTLTSLSVSAPSLVFMAWMANVDQVPEHLQRVRLMIDGSSHSTHLRRLKRFMRKFGPGLKHMCLWFEEVPSRIYDGMFSNSMSASHRILTSKQIDVAAAVRHIPHRTRFSLCFPSIQNRDQAESYANIVCSELQHSVFLRVEDAQSVQYDPSTYQWEELEEAAAREERIENLESHVLQYFQRSMPTANVDQGIPCDKEYLRYFKFDAGLWDMDLEEMRFVDSPC